MSRFDRLVLAAVLGLALAIGALSVALARLGPAIDSVTTASLLDGTLVNTQISLTFTEQMQHRSVERAFRLAPAVRGSFTWSAEEMIFVPRHNLAYGRRYTVTIGTSARASGGKGLMRPFHFSFRTEGQHLMYLASAGTQRGRLILASVSGKKMVIGPSDGLVTDYSVSADRTLAVAVKRGSARERPDGLWLISLQDGSSELVFHRPDWAISQPRLSPDGHYLAFLATNVVICRKYYGCYRDKSGPIIELLNLRSKRVFQFHSPSDVPITDFLDFSPTGQLAFTDLGSALTLAQPDGSGIVHIPNGGNSLTFAGFDPSGARAAFVGQTPESTGGDILVYDHGHYLDVSKGVYDSSSPRFSENGLSLAYAAYRGEKGIEPIYGINRYDVKTGRTTHLTSPRDASDWAPAWSMDGKYIAFVRSAPQEAMYMGAGEVWLARADGKDARPLGGDGQNITWVS